MKHGILPAVVGMGLLSSTFGATATEPLQCEIVWHPSNDTFTGWGYEEFCRDARMLIYPRDPTTTNLIVRTWEFAVRSLEDPAKKLRFDYKCPLRDGYIGLQFAGSIGSFTAEQVKRLEELGEGVFECALLLNGVRHSNVVRLKINHSYTPTNDRPIRLVAIQPLSDNNVTHIGIWAVPPRLDPKLTNFAVWSGTTLVIDGDAHRRGMIMWGGAIYPLPAGKSFGMILPLAGYEPPVQPKRSYKVQAKLFLTGVAELLSGGKRMELHGEQPDYESATTTISCDPEIGKRFDEAFGSAHS